MDAVNSAGRKITAEEANAARASDAARKSALEQTMIAPFLRAGFDADKSLQAPTEKFVAKNFASGDEEQIFSVLLNHYANNVADLERLGLVGSKTAAALKTLKF